MLISTVHWPLEAWEGLVSFPWKKLEQHFVNPSSAGGSTTPEKALD